MHTRTAARQQPACRSTCHVQRLRLILPVLVTLLATACASRAWRFDPDGQAARAACGTLPAGDRYSCVEREAIRSLNPNVCRLAGKWIGDACLQAVYEAAGDPTICGRIYVRGVVTNCQAWYARPIPAAGLLGERMRPDPALMAGSAPKTARDSSAFEKALTAEVPAFPHLCQALGPPDWQTGSGLLILIYELEDGSEVWLGYGGLEQLAYAMLRMPNGQNLDLLPE